MDRLGRRSRFRRTPTGKRLFLTPRDRELFGFLYRYRYLRADHLVVLLQPQSEKRLIERLGDLFHETGLIDRPPAQWRRFDARYQPLVYELSAKGLRYLEDEGELPPRAVTFSLGGRVAQFEHAMMIVDALVETELETRQVERQRFVPVEEILARMPALAKNTKHPLAITVTIGPNAHLPAIKTPVTTHIIPDALYGIEHQINGEKLYRFYALECENRSPKARSTAKLSSLALKRAAYDALLRSKRYQEVWGIPCLELRVVERARVVPPHAQY